MIIDSHVHLKHGNVERTEYRGEEIVEAMDQAGVDRSVVFAMSTTTTHSIEMAREAVQQFPDRLIPYAYALPSAERPILEELNQAISEFGFRGIKLHRGECTLAEYVVDPVLDLAGRRSVPCLIDFTGRWEDLERMASRFPETRLIAAHLGQYLCTDPSLIDRFLCVAEAHDNVWLDISGVVLIWKIREAVERVGADRILWGSDGPHPMPDPVAYLRMEIDKVRMAGLDPDDLEAVLGGNAARLLSA